FQLDSEGVDLQIDRPGTPIGMFVALSDQITTDEFIDRVIVDVERSLQAHLTALPAGRHPVTTTLGLATEQLWQTAEGLQLRALVIPVCNGTGSYVIL